MTKPFLSDGRNKNYINIRLIVERPLQQPTLFKLNSSTQCHLTTTALTHQHAPSRFISFHPLHPSPHHPIPFHLTPSHSTSLRPIPFHSISFHQFHPSPPHSIPFHSTPSHSIPLHPILNPSHPIPSILFHVSSLSNSLTGE